MSHLIKYNGRVLLRLDLLQYWKNGTIIIFSLDIILSNNIIKIASAYVTRENH